MRPREYKGYWPWARVNLQMTRAEFLSLTPAEFFDIIEHWNQRQKVEDTRIARLMWIFSLTLPRKEGDSLPTVEDFMPQPAPPPETEQEEDARLLAQSERMRQYMLGLTDKLNTKFGHPNGTE